MKKSSRRLSREREQVLSDLAEEVASRQALPVVPQVLLQSLGITSSFNDYGDAFDGMLECRSGLFHVYCNLARVESADSPRARFTLAHELGHYFIDEHRNALASGAAAAHPSFCDYQSPEMVEVEADCFASSLLMPWQRFSRSAKKAAAGLNGVIELAKQFSTSISATALRYLRFTDAAPSIIVKWNRDGFGWKRLSTAAYEQGLRRTIEDPGELPVGSATELVLSGRADGVVERGTTAAAWFPFIQSGSFRNALFKEHAVSLGRYGALTMLFPV